MKAMRMPACVIVLVTSALPIGLGDILQAQRPVTTCNPTSSSVSKFTVAASGGIAKGAYQAGALWAILQRERTRRGGDGAADTIPHLVSIAGASAGNVNTLLMATEWATNLAPGNRNERSSLLWETWTDMGIDLLIPEEGSDTVRSLLDASAFNPAKDRLVQLSRTGPFLPCSVPLGITLTRTSTDGRYVVRNTREVVVQRYASIARFNSTRQSFDLDAIPERDVRRSSGATILGPMDSTGQHLDLRQFLQHVQASAAFPVAFPPTPITFRYLEGRDPSARCTETGTPTASCFQEQRDVFLDGGVYDNNPLALALDLVPGSAKPGDEPLRVWFVSPNQRRGSAVLDSASSRRTDDRSTYGALRFLSFAWSIIGTAADYELFALERRLRALDVECRDGRSLCLAPTTRFFPIYGATASSFGAFLGKPLRELDFYVGIYDGVIANIQNGRCSNRTGSNNILCIKDEMNRVIAASTSELPELSAEGRHMLRELWSREFEPRQAGRSLAASRRVEKLLDLLDGLMVEEGRDHKEECKMFSAPVSMFCEDGLRAALRAHKDSPTRYDTIALDQDHDEERFNDLVSSFDTEIFRLVRPLVWRQWMVESGTTDVRFLTRGVAKVASYVIATDEESFRRGFELDPSTVPDHKNEGFRYWPHALPYSIDTWRGSARVSWSPSLLPGRGWELGAGPSIIRTTPVFRTGDGAAFAVAGGLRVRTPQVHLPSWIPNVAIDGQWDCFSIGCTRSVASLSGALLDRRVRIGRTWDVSRQAGRNGLRNVQWIFGLNDFPGIVHVLWPKS